MLGSIAASMPNWIISDSASSGKRAIELVGIGIFVAVAAKEVLLVNQVQDRVRVVAEGRISREVIFDGDSLAAIPARSLVVEGLIQQPLDLRIPAGPCVRDHEFCPPGDESGFGGILPRSSCS